jgi:hypothetical protein
MKRLLLLALALASLLVVFASALPAAARQYDGQASARMSCTVNTVTMTRTVLVTIKWKNVNEGGGVAEAEGLAIESSPADPLAWDSTEISPPEGTGTCRSRSPSTTRRRSATCNGGSTTPPTSHLSRPACSMRQLSQAAHIRSVQATLDVPGVQSANR